MQKKARRVVKDNGGRIKVTFGNFCWSSCDRLFTALKLHFPLQQHASFIRIIVAVPTFAGEVDIEISMR